MLLKLALTRLRDLFRNHALTNVSCQRIVNQIDFIAFIGKVINLTAFVERRTARLKIIVEAAPEI
jgi:hypothetical protein